MSEFNVKDLKKKFGNWARGSRSLATLTSERFPPIHHQTIADNLKIDEKGKNDGEHDLPKSDATQLSATELSIQTEIEKHQKNYIDTYLAHLEIAKSRYSEFTQLWDLNLITNQENKLVDEVIGKGKSIAGTLYETSSDLVNYAKELKKFREYHSLKHRQPIKKNQWNVYLILLLAFFLETAVTFFLTREGGNTTTTITIAVVYCLINCGIPFYFSKFVKWVNYNPSEYQNFKIAGWVILAGLLFVIVFFNLGMGHYRSAAIDFTAAPATSIADIFQNIQEQDNLINMAWANLLENPIGITGLLSWSLIIVGLFCAIISFYDGFTYKDVYPNYLELSEKFKDAFDSYEADIEETLDELNELREGGVREIDDLGALMTASFKDAPRVIAEITASREACKEAINNIENVFNLLCRQYQMENQKFRTSDTPSYFEKPLPFKLAIVPEIGIEEKNPDEKALIGRVKDFSEKLHAEYTQLITSIKTSENVLGDNQPLEIS